MSNSFGTMVCLIAAGFWPAWRLLLVREPRQSRPRPFWTPRPLSSTTLRGPLQGPCLLDQAGQEEPARGLLAHLPRQPDRHRRRVIPGRSGTLYYYSYSGWGLDPGISLTMAGPTSMRPTWAQWRSGMENGHRENAERAANDRNVVIWSWCGGVSDNTRKGINTYLNAMNQLEQTYPG